jgi:hypothetical protein
MSRGRKKEGGRREEGEGRREEGEGRMGAIVQVKT